MKQTPENIDRCQRNLDNIEPDYYWTDAPRADDERADAEWEHRRTMPLAEQRAIAMELWRGDYSRHDELLEANYVPGTEATHTKYIRHLWCDAGCVFIPTNAVGEILLERRIEASKGRRRDDKFSALADFLGQQIDKLKNVTGGAR